MWFGVLLMSGEKGKIEIGEVGFVLFFAYACVTWLCDAFDLFCFLMGLPQVTWISRALVAAVSIGGGMMLRDRVIIRKGKKLDILFMVGCAVILGFCAYKGVIPDLSTDVKKYHYIVQNPGFLSMTSEPFFLIGGFQYYGFRWADRLFYPFRWLFGLRMGTIFGGLVNVLIYAQMRNLLAALYGEELKAVRENCCRQFRQPIVPGALFTESVRAFIITMVYEVWLQSGGYMVDCIAIPFMLEAMHILLTKKEQKLSGEMVWFAVLCGCFFAMKMTHIVYAAPMILVYLIKYRRHLSVRRFLCAFAAALVPVSIYLLYAYADTGNPVFPYFNSVFQSPFYMFGDFKDPRWGPQNLIETLLWPFLSVIKPARRTSEFPNKYAIGMVCMMAIFLFQSAKFVWKKKDRRCGELLAVIFGCAMLWSATTGHVRYFIFGHMLIGVVFVGFAAESLYNRKRVFSLVSIGVIGILLMLPAKYMRAIESGKEWAWRNNLDRGFFCENVKWIFRDRGSAEDVQPEDKPVHTLLTGNANNGGIAHLLYPNADGIATTPLNEYGLQMDISDYWNCRINSALKEGGMYELVIPKNDGLEWEKYFALMEGRGVRITDLIWPDTYLVREQAPALIGLQSMENGGKNVLCTANEETNRIALPNERIRFSACVFLNQTRGHWEDRNSEFCLIAHDGEKAEEVYRSFIRERTTIYIDEVLDLTGFGEDVWIELYWMDENVERIDTRMYDCFMINPNIEVIQ